jgi:hypothetical protein
MLPATPAAAGVPHGGMGAARTDGEHAVTGPHFYNFMVITEFRMLTVLFCKLK